MKIGSFVLAQKPLSILLIVFSFSLARFSSFALPDLTIRAQNTNGILVTWPGAQYYILQTNSGSPAASWVSYGGLIFSRNGTNSVLTRSPATGEFFRLLVPGSQLFTDPTNMPNLAYYWNYMDLISGSGITNLGNSLTTWTDRIGGKVAAPDLSGAVAGTIEPIGVYTSSAPITNQVIMISSNFSCCFIIRPHSVGGTSAMMLGNTSNVGIYIDPAGNLRANWVGGQTASGVNFASIPTNTTWVVCIAFTNGVSTIYTNGALVASGGNIGQPTNNFPFIEFGSFFYGSDGYVQDLMVWTNYTLTAANASSLNLWYWNSNVTNLTNGLIAWWRFDDGSGQNVADSAGSHPGLLTNSPTWVPGQIGDALEFNGTNQFLDITNSSAFADNLTNFTVSCWISTTNSLTGIEYVVVGKVGVGGVPTGIGWFIGAEFGILVAQLQDSNDFYGPSSNVNYYEINDGAWHNIVVTFANSGSVAITMYVDGLPMLNDQGNSSISPGGFSNFSNIRIGADYDGPGQGNGSFPGEIDDVRIYNRILSIQEILDIYKWRGQP